MCASLPSVSAPAIKSQANWARPSLSNCYVTLKFHDCMSRKAKLLSLLPLLLLSSSAIIQPSTKRYSSGIIERHHNVPSLSNLLESSQPSILRFYRLSSKQGTTTGCDWDHMASVAQTLQRQDTVAARRHDRCKHYYYKSVYLLAHCGL